MKIQKFTYKLGFFGPLIIILGSLLTALVYTGKHGEPYSFLNQSISELGEVGVSEWALVFNISLLIGGLCITGFMLGAARLFNNLYGIIFGILGLVTGLSISLVAIFPMNNLEPHILVSMWFFRAWLVSSAVFAIYVLISKQELFSRWISIPAASSSVITFIFLYGTVDRRALLEWGIFYRYNGHGADIFI